MYLIFVLLFMIPATSFNLLVGLSWTFSDVKFHAYDKFYENEENNWVKALST
jgi:hypothetical protein